MVLSVIELSQNFKRQDEIKSVQEKKNRFKSLYTVDGVSYFNSNLLLFIENHNNIEAQSFFVNTSPAKLIDHYGFTLLHYAVWYDNEIMAQYFIDKGCDIDAIDNDGNTPLIHAVEHGYRPTIKALLDVKANVFIYNYNNESVFQMVIKHLLDVNTEVIDMVFDAGKQQCFNDSYELAMKLIEFKLPFPKVILFNDVKLTNLILENACTVNDRDRFGNTALHYAVAVADLTHVKMLLEKGINPELQNNYLHRALKFYNTETEDTEDKLEILRILLDYGKTLAAGSFGNCMLQSNLFHLGKKELIKFVMQWDVNFNTKDEESRTLIHYMSANNNPGIVDILQNIQFDINARDKHERNVLWYAVNTSSSDILEFLLKNGAEVNAVDSKGRTVLFYGLAVWPTQQNRAASMKCLELLLQYKADVQYICNKYESVFHTVLRAITRFELIYVIIAHLTMMEALGNPISEYILDKIHSNRLFFNYFQLCRRQIDNMKEITIFESISLFDILTESQKKLEIHMRNWGLVLELEVLMSQLRRSCFAVEHYEKIYWGRVIEAHRHAKLREAAGPIIARIAQIHCNQFIIDEILYYLDSRDLQNLCLTNFEEV